MSFWGTLAGAATAFIPGVGPLLAPVVGGLVNGITGSGGGSGSTNANPYSPEISSLMKTLGAPGAATDNSATDAAEGYYKTIMSGDQTNTRALLGPDVDTILGQYDNAAKAAANLGPRGGGRDAVLAEAPFKASGAYTKLLGQAKSTAATGLATIGGHKTQAATAQRGQDVSELGTLLGNNNSANQLAFQQQQENNKQLNGLGAGIGSFMTNLLNGQKGKGGTGSDPVTLPSNASFNTNSYDEFS